MADVMEIASNKGIPDLPPLLHMTLVVHVPGKGDGPIWPSVSAGIAVAAVITLQPRQHWTRMSPLNSRGK
jgi:hypothetical protein